MRLRPATFVATPSVDRAAGRGFSAKRTSLVRLLVRSPSDFELLVEPLNSGSLWVDLRGSSSRSTSFVVGASRRRWVTTLNGEVAGSNPARHAVAGSSAGRAPKPHRHFSFAPLFSPVVVASRCFCVLRHYGSVVRIHLVAKSAAVAQLDRAIVKTRRDASSFATCCGNSSEAEHRRAKSKVEGSTPSFRSVQSSRTPCLTHSRSEPRFESGPRAFYARGRLVAQDTMAGTSPRSTGCSHPLFGRAEAPVFSLAKYLVIRSQRVAQVHHLVRPFVGVAQRQSPDLLSRWSRVQSPPPTQFPTSRPPSVLVPRCEPGSTPAGGLSRRRGAQEVGGHTSEGITSFVGFSMSAVSSRGAHRSQCPPRSRRTTP